MNKAKVVCYDEELMNRCDKEFTVVTHMPEENDMSAYSGEFVIMDQRPEDEITEKVGQIKKSMDNKIV